MAFVLYQLKILVSSVTHVKAIFAAHIYIKTVTCRWVHRSLTFILRLSPDFSPFTPKIITLLALLLLTPAPILAQNPEQGAITLRLVNPVTPGQPIDVAVVAVNVPPPGLFGGQFELRFNPAHLRPVASSLTPGPDIAPAAVARTNWSDGQLVYALSRQNDAGNLAGEVTLATLSFEPIISNIQTDLMLENVVLGARGGAPLRVTQTALLRLALADTGGGFTGQIAVDGAPPPPGPVITATRSDGWTVSQTAAAGGQFTLANLPPGKYTLTVEKPGYLPAACAAATAGPATRLTPLMLRAGDVDGSGLINVADAVALGGMMNSPAPDLALDYTADGLIDVLDLILLAANYGQSAGQNAWPCRPL